MKKFLTIIALAGVMTACNNADDADEKSDSTVEAIDSTADAKTDAIDSTADAKIDSVKNAADSAK
jgi:hypothetical protein